jgi:hypothetical protein
MICNSCSTQNSDTAAFCTNCGGLLIKQATPAAEPIGSPESFDPVQPPSYSRPTQPAQAAQPNFQTITARTSGKAVASLVLALFGISLLSVIFGHIARGEIRRSNGTLTGDGLALAGLIIGWIGMGLWLLFWFLIIVAVALT